MKRCLIILLLLTAVSLVHATHLRCGQIRVVHKHNMTYTIKIEVFTNINGTPVLFGGDMDYLSFGDGSPMVLVPEIGPNTSQPGGTYEVINPALGIAKATYSIDHAYAGVGRYTVTYREPNRNADIINVANSVNVPFYLETQFSLDAFLGYLDSPEFLTDPVFIFEMGNPISLSLAAKDLNGGELYYALNTPLSDRGVPVPDYIRPGDASINPFNGLLSWNGLLSDSPISGEYLLSVWVYQYNKGFLVGKVLRDVQILLNDGEFIAGRVFENVELDENKRIILQAGNNTFKVIVEKKANQVSTEVFSSLPALTTVAQYDSLDGESALSVTSITINNDGSLNDKPYLITARTKFENMNHIAYVDRNYILTTNDDPLVAPNVIVMDSEANEPEVTIHPNPTADFLYIKNHSPQLSVNLYTITGKPLPAYFKNGEMDLRAVPAGMYLVILNNGYQQKVVKVLKK